MKLVVNILDNELCSSKARINFNRNTVGNVVKLMCFLNIIQWTRPFIHDVISVSMSNDIEVISSFSKE